MPPKPPADWTSIAPWEQAQKWQEADPQQAKWVRREIRKESRHRWRMELLDRLAKFAPLVAGLVAVGVPAWLSNHYLDRGAPVQGAWIFGTTSVSLASVFVTKVLRARPTQMPPEA